MHLLDRDLDTDFTERFRQALATQHLAVDEDAVTVEDDEVGFRKAEIHPNI